MINDQPQYISLDYYWPLSISVCMYTIFIPKTNVNLHLHVIHYIFFIVGSRDGFIRLWKVSSSYRQMEEVNRIPVKGFVNAIAFSNDGARIVAAVGQGRNSIGFRDHSK